jgi:hypothetical protein
LFNQLKELPYTRKLIDCLLIFTKLGPRKHIKFDLIVLAQFEKLIF